MELLYVYIKQFGNMALREFNLSGNYRFKFQDSKLELMDVEKKVPNGFFGNNISNVTFLIGENGSGKTTFFRFLISELVRGKENKRSDYIAVYCNSNDVGQISFIVVSHGIDILNTNFEYKSLSNPPQGTCFISYEPTTLFGNFESINFEQMGNWINLSDFAVLQRDWEFHKGLDKRELGLGNLIDLSSFYRLTNLKREVSLMVNPSYEGFPMPKFLALKVNHPLSFLDTLLKSPIRNFKDSKLNAWQDNLDKLSSILRERDIGSVISHERLVLSLLIEAFYFDLLGFSSLSMSNNSTFLTFANQYSENVLNWFGKVHFSDSFYIDWLDLYTFDNKEYNGRLGKLISTLKHNHAILDKLRDKNIDPNSSERYIGGLEREDFCFIINCSLLEDVETFADFIDLFSEVLPSSQCFNFDYLNERFESYSMSMGETLRVKFFSRLASPIVWQTINSILGRDTVMLIIDEADLGLHPRWQQSFLRDLYKFIDKLVDHYIGVETTLKVQLIIATHSPIFLSDMPSSNVVWLSKGDGKRRANGTAGFAGNIFELFHDNFFLEDSYIGKFAAEKLESLIIYLANKDETNNDHGNSWNETTARQVIGMINEDVLRSSLEELYDEKFIRDDPNWIDRRIRELENLKKKKSNLDSDETSFNR